MINIKVTKTIDGDIPHKVFVVGRYKIESPVQLQIVRADGRHIPAVDCDGDYLYAWPGGTVVNCKGTHVNY